MKDKKEQENLAKQAINYFIKYGGCTLESLLASGILNDYLKKEAEFMLREEKGIRTVLQMYPSFGVEEKKAVLNYFDSGGWMTEYKKTEELEKMIADFVGTKYCTMLPNGTITLFCALVAYGIGGDNLFKDEVLCPDYTMIATANAIVLAGARPVFVDVEPDTFCISLSDLMSKTTSDTKALMLVSINGRYPENVDAIIDYCHGKGIIVIEDAAQALGSYSDKCHIGTLGHIGSFSFSTPKIVTCGQGGCLVTDDKEIYERLEMMKDFGRPKSGVDFHQILGWNFKFTDLQAVVGIEQMKKLPLRMRRKKEVFSLYKDKLSKVVRFIETDLSQTTPWQNDIIVENRSKLAVGLRERGVETRPCYPSIHMQPPYNWVKGAFLNSDYISQHVLWLPSSVAITDEEIDYVCKCVKEVLK